jgi:Uri superfamily endonuclease
MTMKDTAIIPIGSDAPGGVYLLRIQVGVDLHVHFGRFQGGHAVNLAAGEYVYLGSALARGKTPRLGQRVVRHATRTAGKVPHTIRPALLEHFAAHGLEAGRLLPKKVKKLFWHVDYLLDEKAAEITGVYLIPTQAPIESALAGWLEARPETAITAKGMGASDDSGRTHLLRVDAGADWWANLAELLVGFGESETVIESENAEA